MQLASHADNIALDHGFSSQPRPEGANASTCERSCNWKTKTVKVSKILTKLFNGIKIWHLAVMIPLACFKAS